MSTLKVDAIRHNSATSDAITLASNASNISIGSSVLHGIKSTLITNGDFSNGTTNWTATTSTLSETSGVLTLTPNSGVNGFASQTVTNLVVGKHYNVQVTVTQDAGSYARLYVGTSANGNQNVYALNLGVGTHSFSFKATATTHYVSLVVGGGTGQATKFDDVRLIESNSITFSTPTGDAPSLRPYAFDGMSINTGGVDRLIISNSGITKPFQPFFKAQPSTSQDITSGAGTVVNFQDEIHDVGGNYNASTSTFTAPIGGIYLITWNYFCIPTDNVARANLHKSTNGGSSFAFLHRGDRVGKQGNVYEATTNVAMVDINVNDQLRIQYEDGNLHVNQGYNYFQGYLLG